MAVSSDSDFFKINKKINTNKYTSIAVAPVDTLRSREAKQLDCVRNLTLFYIHNNISLNPQPGQSDLGACATVI